ncbi:MAG: pentapeptide repeat-containing protein, partial [Rickettsia aeschlimannii]
MLKVISIITIYLLLGSCSQSTRDANGLLTDSQSTVIRNYIISQNSKNLKVNLKEKFGSNLKGV